MRKTVQTTYVGDSLGQRLGKFAALAIVVFAMVAAVLITQRLSDDALALIVGLLLAGIPLLAVCGLLAFLVFRQTPRETRQVQAPQPMSFPPIILQMPTMPQQGQLPDYGAQPWAQPQAQPQRHNGGGRAWDLIGDEE